MAIPLDRKIGLLEKKEEAVCEKIYYAYWQGPSILLPKLEAELAAIHRDLVALESTRRETE